MKKRVLCIIFTFISCVILLSGTVFGLTPGSGTCGDHLLWSVSSSGVLTISGYGDMYNFSSEAPWQVDYNYDDFTKIIVKEGVTSIGINAFCLMETDSISLPSSLTTIEKDAFRAFECTDTIIVPEGITYISLSAFYKCSAPELIVSGSPTTILANAFDSSDLCSIDLSNTISIGDYAFENCSELDQSVDLSNVETLGKHAFSNSAITGVTISKKMNTLATAAFEKTYNLYSVEIPANVTTISQYAFQYSALTSLSLNDGLQMISSYAFLGCNIQELALPSTLISIQDLAFQENPIRSLSLPESLSYIGTQALYSTNLKQVILPTNAICRSWPWDGHVLVLDGEPRSVQAAYVYSFYSESEWYDTLGSEPPSSQKFYQFEPDIIELYVGERSVLEGDDFTILDDLYATVSDGILTAIAPGYTVLTKTVDGVSSYHLLHISTCPFSDVQHGQYYTESIFYAYRNGLMYGTGEATFSPAEDLSRSQLVTILYRMEGCPDIADLESPFTDLDANQFYYEAVIWAIHSGITKGTSSNTFSPDMAVTREQFAVLLHRYDTYKNGSEQDYATSDILQRFPDAEALSDWAVESMCWAVENGLINGMGTADFAYLSPDDTTTRAQCATILTRYCTSE